MTLRTVLVTAADDRYARLLRELLQSLAPFRGTFVTTVAVLDLGLSEDNKASISDLVDLVRIPEWDIDLPQQLRNERPHLRALTARPFLADYFPGHDIVLWLDSDTWVQSGFGLQGYIEGAATCGLALTPIVHQNYGSPLETIRWRLASLRRMFGDGAADLYLLNQYYNAGVFAAKSGHPIWRAWERNFAEGLQRCQYQIVTDQNPLNYTIWTESYQVYRLPAIFNWAAHLCLPEIDLGTGLFKEPGPLGRPIGIMHLASQSWRYEINVPMNGASEKMDLSFGSHCKIRQFFASRSDPRLQHSHD